MVRKSGLIATLCELVGEGTARLVDAGKGWPGSLDVSTPSGTHRTLIYVGDVHSMARRPYEVRFQNPGQGHPMSHVAGTVPLLIGVWNARDPPVLVGADADRRMGKSTRFSVRFPRGIIEEAQRTGWANPFISASGEAIYAFHPTLLPLFVEMRLAGLAVPTQVITSAVLGTGVLEDDTEPAHERTRRVTSSLVRSARFSKELLGAYDGRCALCGLDIGLVVGAHIFPVSATGSADVVWNGIALCQNHHAAFDSHRVWINPTSRAVKLHPTILAAAATDSTVAAFFASTLSRLREPADPSWRPKPEMFIRRYRFYNGSYDWAR